MLSLGLFHVASLYVCLYMCAFTINVVRIFLEEGNCFYVKRKLFPLNVSEDPHMQTHSYFTHDVPSVMALIKARVTPLEQTYASDHY